MTTTALIAATILSARVARAQHGDTALMMAPAAQPGVSAAAVAPAPAEAPEAQPAAADPVLGTASPDELDQAGEDASGVSPQPGNAANAGAQGKPARSGTIAPASPFSKFILPGQAAPRLNTFDKVVIGFKDSATPFSVAGWITSATYEEITDGPPNYCCSGKGYVQRIGAAAARGTSEGVFTAAVFAPIFHTDPRYYKLGDRASTFHRIVYAASRTFITRTDSGGQTLNASLLLGYLGGTSLTQAYYPPGNRGFGALSRTYAESLLGASLSFTVSEFLSDALNAVHLQRFDRR